MIIETPSVFRSRYFETSAYRTLLHEYFLNGSRWIAAPKPELKDEIYDDSPEAECKLRNIEIAFDAATCLRAGRDIFFSISETGNELGCRWLQSIIGSEYRVHACYNLNSRIHVDATISLLRPGLVLLNPDRINEHNIPEPLKQWEVLWTPHMAEPKYSEMRQLSSRWLGMNLLMLSPDLAAIDCDQTELIKLLEKRQINVMPVRLRHSRSLLGGVHCVTLDVCRKGKLESYFNI